MTSPRIESSSRWLMALAASLLVLTVAITSL
jgi:hypothetical protein